ncbi:MAG: hypothetical protein HOV79_26630 [Hamadaea sp.]|nr:hypothetical protein [Hamadaea sp.]
MPAHRTFPADTRRAVAAALTLAVLVLAAVASAVGLLADGFYPDIPWASAALRGGDLVTLAVAVPTLATSLVLARRGSARAHLVWAGTLGYLVYTYAYVAFGAEFNDLFLAHVAILALAIWAVVFLLTGLPVEAVATVFGPRTPARTVAAFYCIVAAVLIGLWSSASLRQAITGELPDGVVPPSALHMVYATDLVFFVSPLVVAAVLLWRRTLWGFAGGTVMAVTGGLYLINLMSAAYVQAAADVPDVAAFSPGTLALAAAFLTAAVVLPAFPWRPADMPVAPQAPGLPVGHRR